ncbi:MAG TPA: inositol 2-dehydrogenase, partial [Candidatus Atribacteria bacterium]|nr:inositol 2-dehydrogenase [Candidatus Atribacteria bacterium]
MEKVGIGIIGAGRIGSLHARNIANEVPNGKVLAIADIFENSAKKVAEEVGIPHVYKDYRYILDNKDIDAVFICTSTDTHAKLIKEASDAKKDIFCEK